MAPLSNFFAGAAVITAVFAGSAQAQINGVESDICQDAINIARAARMDLATPLKSLTKKQVPALEAAVKTLIKSDAATACELQDTGAQLPYQAQGFVWTQEFGKEMTAEGCKAFVQTMIEEALKQLEGKVDKAFNPPTDPYTEANVAAQNFAFVMDKGATTFSCYKTDGCQSGVNVMLCRFAPQLAKGDAIHPFSAEVFAAVKARFDAGKKIQEMTAEDIDKPLSDGSGARAVVPAAGLVVALLGFLYM